MGSVVSKWVIPGIITLVVGTLVAVYFGQSNMEADLTQRAQTAISTAGDHSAGEWAQVTFEGRDATISGVTTDPDSIETLIDQVSALHGVRSVTSDIIPAPTASPYPFSARLENGAITLNGGVPSLKMRDELLAQSGAKDDGLKLLSGVPDGNWQGATLFAISQLDGLESGVATLADLSLSVSGIAKTPQAYVDVNAGLMAGLPGGISLEGNAIEPAFVEDFIFDAMRKSGVTSVSGFVPDEATRARIGEMTDADTTGLLLAQGAPQSLPSALEYGLGLLSYMSDGELTISGANLSVSGVAASHEDYAAAVKLLEQGAPDGVDLAGASLEPATQEDYFWSVQKLADGSLTIRGYVPDEATRTAILARAGALATDQMQIANGAPATFYEDALVSISALQNLESGRAGFGSDRWFLAGKPANVDDAEAAAGALITARTIASEWDVSIAEPPLVAVVPYAWSARKSADGQIVLKGNVPDELTRTALLGRAGDGAADQMQVSYGAPMTFYEDALVAISALRELESGRAGHGANGWYLSGQPSNADAVQAATGALITARTLASDWNVDLAEPPLVAVVPYAWSARKSADGQIVLKGNVPDELTRTALLGRAGDGAADQMQVSYGAPMTFYEDALVAISALRELESGRAGHGANGWYLSGQPLNSEAADMAAGALITARTPASDWNVDLAAPLEADEPVEVVEEATEETVVASVATASFAAELSDGSISLSGQVPDSDSRKALSLASDGAATGGLLESTSGVPENFLSNAQAGIGALRLLTEGRMALEGGQWSLSGKARDASARDAALGLVAELDDAEMWQTDIALFSPNELCQSEVSDYSGAKSIEFKSGSAQISTGSLSIVQELAGYLNRCAAFGLTVEGHTDNQGDFAANLSLSIDRADAVIEALKEMGVDGERMLSVGFGEASPVEDNGTADGRQANRRIVFQIKE